MKRNASPIHTETRNESVTHYMFGDEANALSDKQGLVDCLNRQGVTFMLAVAAESCGKTAREYCLDEAERENIARNYCAELDLFLKTELKLK